MLKGGIFLDVENLVRSGGWQMAYTAVSNLVEAQGVVVLRANAYMAVDEEREKQDFEYGRRKREARNRIRKQGYHLVLKPVQRYQNPEGETITKANADLDLAVDALLQAENLDYILLGTGDGDFLRLVRALQSRGKRVDLLAFSNLNHILRQEVDFHFPGYLIPGILPREGTKLRGYLHAAVEEKGFGFITFFTGMKATEIRDDLFCHVYACKREDGSQATMDDLIAWRNHETVLEFELGRDKNGREVAVDVRKAEI